MRRAFFVLLLCACGSAPGGGNTGTGVDLAMTDTAMIDMAMMMGADNIPDPGITHDVDQDFANKEPNNTPSQATPLGVSTTKDIYVWVTMDSIGGGDTADYFVFKTGPQPGQFTLGTSGLCWSGQITSLSATLWKVVAKRQMLPPIHQWMGSGSCVQSSQGDAPVEANTVYLLGVIATGGPGTYFA